jgi:hypothetical protein
MSWKASFQIVLRAVLPVIRIQRKTFINQSWLMFAAYSNAKTIAGKGGLPNDRNRI